MFHPRLETAISHGMLLVDVDELITHVFQPENSVVDFTTLRSVLVMLASHMRLLEQDVEIRFTEQGEIFASVQAQIESRKKKVIKTDGTETDAGEDGKPLTGKISVTEVTKPGPKGTDSKMLIVETSSRADLTSSQTRIGAIEVVTLSQFDLLKNLVQELTSRVEYLTTPTMPADKELMEKLSKGIATLPDTMDAVQLKERLDAAEEALNKMAVLLTRLVLEGVLPPCVADTIASMAEAMGIPVEELDDLKALAASEEGQQTLTSRFSGVTPPAMQKRMDTMVKDTTKKIDDAASKVGTTIDMKELVAKGIVEKIETILEMDNRLETLYSIVSDYSEHLDGFSNGLDSQLKLYKEQITEMEANLGVALTALEGTANRPDSSGMVDLKATHQSVLKELENTSHFHSVLMDVLKQRVLEVKRMIDCVEKLGSELADRDEVADRMRDKADTSRLLAIVTTNEFERTRQELICRIEHCNSKFKEQRKVWQEVINDLSQLLALKADQTMLNDLFEFMKHGLDTNMEMLRRLSVLLGVPKTMLLARYINIPPKRSGRPVRRAPPPPPAPPADLPAEGEASPEEEGEASPEEELEAPPDRLPSILINDQLEDTCVQYKKSKEHLCHRYVGGSHTLLSGNVIRQEAPYMDCFEPPHTRKYVAPGPDNHAYFMETDLVPCEECNKSATEVEDGPAVDA